MTDRLMHWPRWTLLSMLAASLGCANIDPGGALDEHESADVAAQWRPGSPWPRPRNDAGTATCNVTPCERAARSATADLAAWALPVQTCCHTRSQCGLRADPTAKPPRPATVPLVTAIQEMGCLPAGQFTLVTASYKGIASAPSDGPAAIVRDGGVVLADGGIIDLDEKCPNLHGDTGLFIFDYPGCCLPSGECGNSNHTLAGLPAAGEPHRCLTFEELSTVRSEFVPVPETPTACTP
jgi:hypothetical protein